MNFFIATAAALVCGVLLAIFGALWAWPFGQWFPNKRLQNALGLAALVIGVWLFSEGWQMGRVFLRTEYAYELVTVSQAVQGTSYPQKQAPHRYTKVTVREHPEYSFMFSGHRDFHEGEKLQVKVLRTPEGVVVGFKEE